MCSHSSAVCHHLPGFGRGNRPVRHWCAARRQHRRMPSALRSGDCALQSRPTSLACDAVWTRHESDSFVLASIGSMVAWLSRSRAGRRRSSDQRCARDRPTRAVRQLLFVGGWGLEQGLCGHPGQPPPVRTTATRAETSGGFCIFNSIQPNGNAAWRIEANCSTDGVTRLAHIRLTVEGSVLRWTSKQPEVRYFRCPASQTEGLR